MARFIAFWTNKGGVGKTTSAANIGYYLSQVLKKRVLLIDADRQGNLTMSFGLQDRIKNTLKGIFQGTVFNKVVIDVFSTLKFIGCNDTFRDIRRLFTEYNPELTLRKLVLEKLSGFDYVLFDCPPEISPLNDNILCCCGEVWSPLQTEYLALEGVETVVNHLSTLNEHFGGFGVNVKLTVVIPTMYDGRSNLPKEVIRLAQSRYPINFTNPIRRSIKQGEAPSHGETIFEYAPNSTTAKDYELAVASLDSNCFFDLAPNMLEEDMKDLENLKKEMLKKNGVLYV